MKQSSHAKIDSVETIRGLAALLVCLFHFTKTNINFYGNSSLYQQVFNYGWVGVEAFFVVSGFIIPYSMIKNGYTINQFFRFLAKRCVRIEPPYIVSILLVIVLGYIVTIVPGYNGTPFVFNFYQVASHIAYMPGHLGFEWLQPVYWSLEAEFHYYILIGLLLPLLWKNNFGLMAGLLIAGVSSFFIPLTVFSYMPFFVMGIAGCAYRLEKINVYYFLLLLIVSAAILIQRGQPLIMPVTGAITILLICFVRIRSRITDFLGKISFSLYLLHVPVGSKVLNMAGRYVNNEWKVWASLAIALGATLLASWIFYKLVEYPSIILSKRIHYRFFEKGTDNITPLSSR